MQKIFFSYEWRKRGVSKSEIAIFTIFRKKSLISNTNFSILENDFLKICLLETVISNLILKNNWGYPRGAVCVRGGGLVVRACYRGCYVLMHSKPSFEIKSEITVFEIRGYCFRDYRIRG